MVIPDKLIHRRSYSVSQRLILCKTAELIWALDAGSKLILYSFWPALQLCILLSISLQSVESLISLSQPHIVVRKSLFRLPKSVMLTSPPVAWKFSFSLRLYKNCTYHQLAPLFFLCKSYLTNLLLQLSSCLFGYKTDSKISGYVWTGRYPAEQTMNPSVTWQASTTKKEFMSLVVCHQKCIAVLI